MTFKNPEKIVRIATISVIIYLVCFGIAMAFFPIRPFWNDEWRLIYNIKFKSESQLWGVLDLLQECPRTYLTMLKKISASFDYSYTSLRLPPLLLSIATIFFLFHLRKRIFRYSPVYGYLFILIFISSQTFTDYIVQVKQYEMDLFLCLLALWQLMTMREIAEQGIINRYKYLLLCFSFLAVPYFSYIYPIAIAPIFPIVLLHSITTGRQQGNKTKRLLYLYTPLVLVTISIIIFYRIDVKNVMCDHRMYISYIRYCYNGVKETFAEDFWKLFSLVGSGFLFELIFGVLGVSAFFYGIYKLAKAKTKEHILEDYLRLYAVLLLVMILVLFISGKLLGGVARLTSFAVPSISILIVYFFDDVKNTYRYPKPVNIVAGILFIGLSGNVISTCINRFTYVEYNNRIHTYWHTSQALKEARLSKVPILYTDAVRGANDGIHGDQPDVPGPVPGKIMANTITPAQIRGADTLCSEVILKVNPEYKVWNPVPTYMIPDMKWLKEYMHQLPPQYNAAIVCDGIHFFKLSR